MSKIDTLRAVSVRPTIMPCSNKADHYMTAAILELSDRLTALETKSFAEEAKICEGSGDEIDWPTIQERIKALIEKQQQREQSEPTADLSYAIKLLEGILSERRYGVLGEPIIKTKANLEAAIKLLAAHQKKLGETK